jgi:hypothetical protein
VLRGLKITMFVFGAILAVEGILDIAAPVQRAQGMGLGECAAHAQMPMAILGATWLVAGIWTIIGARDPMRHLSTVKLALSLPLVLLLALLGLALRGDVALQDVAIDIAADALFFVLFLVFYPRQPNSDALARPMHATKGT